MLRRALIALAAGVAIAVATYTVSRGLGFTFLFLPLLFVWGWGGERRDRRDDWPADEWHSDRDWEDGGLPPGDDSARRLPPPAAPR